MTSLFPIEPKTGIVANMGKTGFLGDQFRHRLIAERQRRGWTQGQVADMLKQRGVPSAYTTTIAKLEAGHRAVRIDELWGLADLFGISVDALIGRQSSGSDLMWAISKLSTNAQKCVGDVSAIHDRIAGDVQDVHHYEQFDNHPIDVLMVTASQACRALDDARKTLNNLANAFPLPGGNLARRDQ